MSYLLANTPPDQLLLMIAAEDGRERPEPYPLDPDCPDITDHLRHLWARGLIYTNPRQYAVVHLTWDGWDLVHELLDAGRELPSAVMREAYAKHARIVVEGGDHGDLIPLDIPNPAGVERPPPDELCTTGGFSAGTGSLVAAAVLVAVIAALAFAHVL